MMQEEHNQTYNSIVLLVRQWDKCVKLNLRTKKGFPAEAVIATWRVTCSNIIKPITYDGEAKTNKSTHYLNSGENLVLADLGQGVHSHFMGTELCDC